MKKYAIVQDNECNVVKIPAIEFYNYILPFGWSLICLTDF